MTKLKLTAAFALVAAALGGCTVCVDCEPQSSQTDPLGRQGSTYYYSDSWTEPRRQASWAETRPAVSTSYNTSYYSSPAVISTPIISYRPVTQPTWRTTSRPATYSSSYYPKSYQYYYQRPAVNRQYANWPYDSPPELPSAEWQARYIGQQPRTMYYYPSVNSFTNSGSSSTLRRYWPSQPMTTSSGQRPIYLGPVWYYP